MPGWGVVLVALACTAALLVALDRAVARGWFDGVRLTVRSRAQRSGEATGGGGGSGMLGDLVEIFQPNHVHLTAERRRQAADVVREGDAAPPDGGPAHHLLGRRDSEPTVP